MTDYSRNLSFNAAMPPQKVSMGAKNKKWREQCVSAIATMSNNRGANGRSTWGNKQVNYDLVNSIINEKDYSYVLDPFGSNKTDFGGQPARLRDINLIANKLRLLQGEELQRPFNFQVIATNGEAVSEKETKKREFLQQAAYQQLAKELGVSLEPDIDPQTGEEIPVTFAGIDKYMNYSYSDLREKWGNEILQYIKHKENIPLKFNEGWEHALISAEEIYYIGIVNGEPKVRICNPLNCEFDGNPDNPNIEDGDWFREDRQMTTGQIIDEFGEFLTPAQIDMLDKGQLRKGTSNSMFPGIGYLEQDIESYGRNTYANKK